MLSSSKKHMNMLFQILHYNYRCKFIDKQPTSCKFLPIILVQITNPEARPLYRMPLHKALIYTLLNNVNINFDVVLVDWFSFEEEDRVPLQSPGFPGTICRTGWP